VFPPPEVDAESDEHEQGGGGLAGLGDGGCACRVVQHEVVALEIKGKGAASEGVVKGVARVVCPVCRGDAEIVRTGGRAVDIVDHPALVGGPEGIGPIDIAVAAEVELERGGRAEGQVASHDDLVECGEVGVRIIRELPVYRWDAPAAGVVGEIAGECLDAGRVAGAVNAVNRGSAADGAIAAERRAAGDCEAA